MDNPLNQSFADKVCVVGIGETQYTRYGHTKISERALACQAIKAAADDAGIDVREIDGFVSFYNERSEPGLVQQALGIPHIRYSALAWGYGGNVSAGPFLVGGLAVAAGRSKYCVLYRSLAQGEHGRFGQARQGRQTDNFYVPYGLMTPGQVLALHYRTQARKRGWTTDHLAEIAVSTRWYANQNPRAVMYRKPLTKEDYYRGKMISDPLRIYDLCIETDGACAIILASPDRAKDLRQPVVRILSAVQLGPWGAGYGVLVVPGALEEESVEAGNRLMVEELFAIAGISPHDVNMASIYDSFTPQILMGLEDWGFCNYGEAGEFVEAGNLRLGGKLPTNTSGGHLSEAYIHGLNLAVETIRQARGTSTAQVPDCKITFFGSAAGSPGSAVLFAAD